MEGWNALSIHRRKLDPNRGEGKVAAKDLMTEYHERDIGCMKRVSL